MTKMRINLANPQELLELPGLLLAGRDNIVRHRAEHGPISSAEELTRVIWPLMTTPAMLALVDYQPAASTAAEAPGA